MKTTIFAATLPVLLALLICSGCGSRDAANVPPKQAFYGSKPTPEQYAAAMKTAARADQKNGGSPQSH